MPSLWLPPGVGDEMLETQRSAAARTIVGDFEKRLKAIDPRTGVCFVDQPDDEGALRVGFWHIYRRNPDGTTTWWEVSGPNGEFMEPNDKVLERLREHDAERRRPDDYGRQQDRRLQAQERRRAREREANRDRLQELADFEFRTQVPVTPDGRGRLRTRTKAGR